MTNMDLTDLGLAVARGDIALWIGPDWTIAAEGRDLEFVANTTWLGIWSESNESTFASALDHRMRERVDPRLLIEVPDQIEAALAEYYKFAEVCPYFYLNGKSGYGANLSKRQRERSRVEKSRELNRLGPGVLLVVGYSEIEELARTLSEEIIEDAPNLRGLFVTGLQNEDLQLIRARMPTSWINRLGASDLELPALLRVIEEKRRIPIGGPSVRIGKSLVPLQNLLRTEPPIDQDYLLLTADAVRDPEATEDTESLITDLLAGREPWRALAHNLAWDRATVHRDSIRQCLQRFRTGERRVQVVEIPAESGSGLTVLLQQIAYETARAGYPTLFHRPRDQGFEYNAIRRFLTDLYQSKEIASQDLNTPAVLIFDAPSMEADAFQKLYDLPDRLNRDDRRVLIVRAVPIRDLIDTEVVSTPVSRSAGAGVSVDRLEPLRATLTQSEQGALAEWARTNGSCAAPALNAIVDWHHSPNHLPLMIALYFILKDNLRSQVRFGKHLLATLRRIISTHVPPEKEQSDDKVLTAEELKHAVRLLQQNLTRAPVEPPPTPSETKDVFITLAVLSCLRLVVSRGLLADMVGIPRHRVNPVLALLEAANLVTTDLPFDVGSPGSVSAPRTSVAYYTAEEALGMRHPAYGRLVLEWLASMEGLEDKVFFTGGLGREVLDRITQQPQLGWYPLHLLQPLLARVNRPRDASHVQFTAYLALRYLRLPKKLEKRRSELAAWQWQNVHLLREVLSWLNPQVVNSSVITLHSRGITRYKTAYERSEYAEAERDFLSAIELAHRTQEEHPVNIMTSLGLLYRGWARCEREHGDVAKFHDIDRKTEQTLREALRERQDNSFAAFGLARYLVDCYEDNQRQIEESVRASVLAEAIELLQLKPEANFQDEWQELFAHAVELLTKEDAERLINSLIGMGDELGYALMALRCLEGYIFTEPTENEYELRQLHDAGNILRHAEQENLKKRSPLADLLRYVVFSADGVQRNTNPAFRTRFELLRRLEGTVYLERPIWLFDFASLAFQVGCFQDAAMSFARLRRGQRFFEVSKERGTYWTEDADSLKPRTVYLRVISGGPADERGWGRIEKPSGYRELVPFSVRAFASRGKSTRIGSGNTCYIRINPAGPYAEPELR